MGRRGGGGLAFLLDGVLEAFLKSTQGCFLHRGKGPNGAPGHGFWGSSSVRSESLAFLSTPQVQ
jgi:hypothetical protein